MKKIIAVLMILLCTCTLFTACAPANSLPYKVWADWDEMKEALGDRYLYPTYLPEFTESSEGSFLRSDYNYYPINKFGISPNYPLSSSDPDLYFGYSAKYNSDIGVIDFFVCDYKKMRDPTSSKSYDYYANYGETFHETTELVRDTEVKFVTKYVEARFTPTDVPISSGRMVCVNFNYKEITYSAHITQSDIDVDIKYADDEQRAELLKVAQSIIEQKTGDD